MRFLVGLGLACLLLISCGTQAKDYLGETEVRISKDGEWYYKSNKNQELLKASIGTDQSGRPNATIETTASTPEAAIANVAAAQARLAETLNNFITNIVPLIQNMARQGAIAGS